MDNNTSAATASVLAGFFMIYAIVIVAILAFTIWVYWRIFTRAGFNGALSLLNLVPGVGPLICMILLAFGRWPIEDELDALRGGRPAPGPLPGTSVIPS